MKLAINVYSGEPECKLLAYQEFDTPEEADKFLAEHLILCFHGGMFSEMRIEQMNRMLSGRLDGSLMYGLNHTTHAAVWVQ